MLIDLVKSNVSKKGKTFLGCAGCKRMCKKDTVVYGEGKKGIVIVTPYNFVTNNKPSKEYLELKKELFELGISLNKDAYITSISPCITKETEHRLDIQDKNYMDCSTTLIKEIKKLKPKVIIPLGALCNKFVIGSRLGGRLSNVKGGDFFNYEIPDQEFNAWIVPVFGDYEKAKNTNRKSKRVDPVFISMQKKQLKTAVSIYNKPLPVLELPKIEYMWTVEEANEWLSLQHDLWLDEEVSFDLETTGLKPQSRLQKIRCIAFRSKDVCGVMPYFVGDESFREKLKKIMTNPRIKKIAQKLQYEDGWIYEKGDRKKYRVNGWYWDTLLAEHCINSKAKTSLKFQTYVYLGVLNYDGDVDKFLKTKEKSCNAINNVFDAPMDKLMEYCAYDTIYTQEAYYRQKEWFNRKEHKHLLKGLQLLIDGSICLSTMHINGQGFDTELAIMQKVALEKEIKDRLEALRKQPYSKGWDGSTGGASLFKHVYNTLGLINVDGKKTSNNKEALDVEVLLKMNHPFTIELVKIKQLEKVVGTYLESYLREEVNGKVHPWFSLDRTATFRSSSQSPNAQNVPKRNKKIKAIIRNCIIPRKGSRIMAWDYKALETIIAGCNYHDTNWIKYQMDLSADMHWDWTVMLLDLDEDFIEDLILDKIKGELRGWVKNQAVFPSIFGSSPFNIANSLHTKMKYIPLVWDWFEEKGWDNIELFRKHVEKKYDYFWNEWFNEYKDIREKDWELYQKQGYIDNLTGFRYQGILGYTEFCNYKIQGSASHIKLWTAIEVEKEIKRRGLKSYLIGEIHDEILCDVPEDETFIMNELVQEIGTKLVREHWDWIIIPLVMDCEATPVDGTWETMDKLAKYR